MSRNEEDLRAQQEKEAYRETQKSVYARIYQEQDEMPEDYEEAFREEETQEEKLGKRKLILITILLMLVALVGAALAAHAILVHRPALPEETAPVVVEPQEVTDRKEDVYTFLLVGRDSAGGGNTDTIMVGSLDGKNGTLDILSIYRDTLVDVPWEIKKINSVYNFQGIEGLQEQVKNLVGFQPDYYIVMEMDAVARIVNALGGVDYDVPYNMHYDDPSQDLHIHFEKGEQHLNGEDTVKVLRWRKNNSGESLSVGDVGRVEIQHDLMKALAEQAISLENLGKVQELVSIVEESITSDLDYGEMLWMGEQVLGMDRENIHFYGLPGDFTGTIWSPTYQNYQSYVFVNPTALLDIVNGHLNPFLEPIPSTEQHVIHGTDVVNEPSLPPSTGLPILQPGEYTGNEMETPSGAVQSVAPPQANQSQTAETKTEEARTGGQPADNGEADTGETDQNGAGVASEIGDALDPDQEPAAEPAPEPAAELAPEPAAEPAPASEPEQEPAPVPSVEVPSDLFEP